MANDIFPAQQVIYRQRNVTILGRTVGCCQGSQQPVLSIKGMFGTRRLYPVAQERSVNVGTELI